MSVPYPTCILCRGLKTIDGRLCIACNGEGVIIQKADLQPKSSEVWPKILLRGFCLLGSIFMFYTAFVFAKQPDPYAQILAAICAMGGLMWFTWGDEIK